MTGPEALIVYLDTPEERERAERLCPARGEEHHYGHADCDCNRIIAEFRSAESAARQQYTARAIKELLEAEQIAIDWAHSAGWATGHGDTLADILREMRRDQQEQRGHIEAGAREEERERSERIATRIIIKWLEDGMACNCDLDNWELDRRTGHSSVCQIHKTAIRALAGEEKP